MRKKSSVVKQCSTGELLPVVTPTVPCPHPGPLPLGREREKESPAMVGAPGLPKMTGKAERVAVPVGGSPTGTGGSPVLPMMVEFKPVDGAGLWRVEKFDLLASEILAESQRGELHTDVLARFVFFCQRHPRSWLLVRRLYGVAPVIPAADASPEDLRVWTRAEMEAEGYAVTAELELLRSLWGDEMKRERVKLEPPSPRPSPAPAGEGGELRLDDRLLEWLNFSERLFKISVYDPLANGGKGGVVPRADTENRAERDWFVSRVTEWAKMLGDSIGGPLARSALMNEMTMRRLESEIAVADPKQRAALYEQKAAEVRAYKASIEELQRMFPEMAVAGKVSFRAVVSDLVLAHQDYYGNADRQLVDKVFTVTEIEFLTRTSAQVEARYRFSLNLAIVACINGLYDPNFRQRFKPKVLKLIDAGFRAGMEAARAAQREKLVDLENGVLPGEGDEFEDFYDAECPHCGGRISAKARRCPECRKVIKEHMPRSTGEETLNIQPPTYNAETSE